MKWATLDDKYDKRVQDLVCAVYDANRDVETYTELPAKIIRAVFTLTYVRSVNYM